MPKKVLEGIKPFNEMSLKSCYYNQMVAAYSYFGVDPKIIASNVDCLTSVGGEIVFNGQCH